MSEKGAVDLSCDIWYCQGCWDEFFRRADVRVTRIEPNGTQGWEAEAEATGRYERWPERRRRSRIIKERECVSMRMMILKEYALRGWTRYHQEPKERGSLVRELLSAGDVEITDVWDKGEGWVASAGIEAWLWKNEEPVEEERQEVGDSARKETKGYFKKKWDSKREERGLETKGEEQRQQGNEKVGTGEGRKRRGEGITVRLMIVREFAPEVWTRFHQESQGKPELVKALLTRHLEITRIYDKGEAGDTSVGIEAWLWEEKEHFWNNRENQEVAERGIEGRSKRGKKKKNDKKKRR